MKRLFDIVVALAVLALTWPLLLLIALLVRIFLGGPVLFRQERPGKEGEIFTLLKFRTMCDRRGEDGAPLPDRERLGRFGRLLRATSLDELPEFFNILRGDMSLVGPRPLLLQYLDRYTEEQARRHDVRPGLTGWAQVNGRNAISWEEKFALDLWYVEHQSFLLDLRILLMTVWLIARRKGVSAEGHPTAPEFMGSEGEETSGRRQ